MDNLNERLAGLIKQATEDRSHYYVRDTIIATLTELTRLQDRNSHLETCLGDWIEHKYTTGTDKAEPRNEWQPISSAPNGNILVYREKINMVQEAYSFGVPHYISTLGLSGSRIYDATHWQKLPEPPK